MSTEVLDKTNQCVRLARECNHDYLETGDKRFKQIRIEAMQDARYWKYGSYP